MNLLRHFASLGVALTVAYLIISGGLGVWQQYNLGGKAYIEYQQQAEQHEREAANEIMQKCQTVAPVNPAFSDCLFEAIKSYQLQDRARQDLKAQQDMAYWSMLTVILSAVGLGVSILGLYALYRSLVHTRTAIKDTREIGEAEVRAYIGVDISSPTNLIIREITAGKPIEVEFGYKNNGASPANRVAYVAICEIREHPIKFSGPAIIVPAVGQLIAPNTMQSGVTAFGKAGTAEAVTPELLKEVMEGEKRIYLIFRAEYDDVFGRRHFSNGCFYLKFLSKVKAGGQSELVGKWHLAQTHNNAD
ncbi:hypothetical protein [Mesorhizobium shangrilense]|uniref:Uncharacterized protein n=1 Tax=Mesorhizobium shangrilense TaxID=460060 RepID=A0ABV2DP33_9HYPH